MALGRAAAAASEWCRSLGRELSLRSRLLLGLVLVAAVGLVAADVVVYGQVESFLTSQIDGQLPASLNPFIRQVQSQLGGISGFGGGFAGSLDFRQDTPRGAYGAVVYGAGTVYTQTFQGNTPLGPPPAIPRDLVTMTEHSTTAAVTALGAAPAIHLTVGAVGRPTFRYRLISVALPTNQPSVAVVALPLDGVDATLRHLVGIDIVASAAVLAILAGLGYLVVRVGMRPLGEIELTAQAIAAGDLGRRVAREDERTEVGRLGSSLNAMLGQIEHAFAEQRGSENRLRQFLADASHELRTPVTSIRGYSELFRRGASGRPEDLALAMRRIEDEAIRMGVLVDDLLLLARLDQGRPIEHVPVDLAAIGADAAADAQVLAPDRAIVLDAPQTVTVSGDEQRLRQVATNLVQNAIRHTPAGSPVQVSVRRTGASAVLAVRDEGPGLSPEHAARIFERFYRADPSRTRVSGGTGLGLSIVKSIAEAHGGSARVETAPGEGATFSVELPMAPDAPAGVAAGALPVEMSRVVEAAKRPPVS
ncbi:MAG TPA: HAMP domain-containing sensor histidine kinase [Acidimicrobiales bacterium]|nr:HAMP domain-containing sensor histidine kinase [Acidimicrobiales bacterium]